VRYPEISGDSALDGAEQSLLKHECMKRVDAQQLIALYFELDAQPGQGAGGRVAAHCFVTSRI
jgi:hypothetical protein